MANDETELRDGIETWAIARDTGDWERLASVWHTDGRMVATWFEGSAEEFISACRRAWGKGVLAQHVLGGTAIRRKASRAICETRMTIMVRTEVEGVLCDLSCVGLFFDLWLRTESGWRLRWRQPVYEKDRLDPVAAGFAPVLDPAILGGFPIGYRHLAYQQFRSGLPVNRNLPGTGGADVAPLYAAASAWLDGGPLPQAAEKLTHAASA